MGRLSVRAAGIAGIVFVILVAAPGFASGQPPDPGDPASKFLSYNQDHRGGIMAATFLGTLSIFFVVFFLGGLVVALRRQGAQPALLVASLASLVLSGGLALAGGAFGGVAAFRVDQAQHPDAETVRMLSDASSFLFTLIGVPLAAFLATTGLLVAATRLFPAWLSWLAGIGAVLEIVGAAGVLASPGGYAPGGGAGLVLVLLPFAVFMLATSIVMIVRGDAMEGSEAASSPPAAAVTS